VQDVPYSPGLKVSDAWQRSTWNWVRLCSWRSMTPAQSSFVVVDQFPDECAAGELEEEVVDLDAVLCLLKIRPVFRISSSRDPIF